MVDMEVGTGVGTGVGTEVGAAACPPTAAAGMVLRWRRHARQSLRIRMRWIRWRIRWWYGGGYGVYGGGMYGGYGGGYGGGMYGGGMYGPTGPMSFDPNEPVNPAMSAWSKIMRTLSDVVHFFGKISFLVDENTQALHFFVGSLLGMLDRGHVLYKEMSRIVLKTLGYPVPERPPPFDPLRRGQQQGQQGQYSNGYNQNTNQQQYQQRNNNSSANFDEAYMDGAWGNANAP